MLSSSRGATLLWPFVLTIILCLPAQAQSGYLHQSSTSLVDNSSKPILLHGVNLGCWLYPEPWMIGNTGIGLYEGRDGEPDKFADAVKIAVGTDERAAAFTQAWRDSFVTRGDIDALKKMGMNSVRVPLAFRLFYNPATRQDRDTGFSYLDSLLQWCAADGLYVILDMHVVPGGKTYLKHWYSTKPEDVIPGNVYSNSTNHALLRHIWTRIAQHYADNHWIGGYDLINEPVAADPYQWQLRNLYSDLKDSIRSVDPNHLLIVEGDAYGTVLDVINRADAPWHDTNIAYSDHHYGDRLPLPPTNKRQASTLGVPLWLGEFGYNANTWNNTVIAESEGEAKVGAGWCYWAYKSTGIWSLQKFVLPPGYRRLQAYWKAPATAPKPTQSEAYDALMQLARGTHITKCTTNKDVADGLNRPHTAYTSRRLPYGSGLTIPGQINAMAYDLGAEGVAYHDTVSTDEAGKGPGGRAWNSGWNGRNDGVDLFPTSDTGTGFYLGGIQPGEWVDYTVTSQPGTYTLSLRHAGPGGRMRLKLGGVSIIGEIRVPATPDWHAFQTLTLPNLHIRANGSTTLQLAFDSDGFNLNWLRFDHK